MQLQIAQALNTIRERKTAPINIDMLKYEINEFFLNIKIRSLDSKDPIVQEERTLSAIRRLRRARSHFDRCLSILKASFELEYNSYIQDMNKKSKVYNDFLQLLGVLNARLDVISEKIQDLDRRRSINEDVSFPSLILIEDYKETLLTYMQNIILSPVIEALRKFYALNIRKKISKDNKENIEELIKDPDLFLWLMFREVNSSAQIEGSIERQASFTGKFATLKRNDIMMSGTSLIPENARYREVPEEEIRQQIRDPFADTGEEDV